MLKWILAVSLISLSVDAKIRFPVPRANACSFYSELAKELKCDEPNYLTGYGQKYCTEFQGKTDVSVPLKSWTSATTLCLQKTLTYDEELLKPCSKIQDLAFDSHPRCYHSAGFCELSDDNKKAILAVVSFTDVRSNVGNSLVQALSVRLKCDFTVSTSVILVLSYLHDIARLQAEPIRAKASMLVDYIFRDYEKITERANSVWLSFSKQAGIAVSTGSTASNSALHRTTEAAIKNASDCQTKGFAPEFCTTLAMRAQVGSKQEISATIQGMGRAQIDYAYDELLGQKKK